MASSECLALATPISSTVCGLVDKASVADVRKVSIVCTSLVIERLREVNNASKSCCMWSSIVDLTGDVDTLIQSTLMFLFRKRRNESKSHLSPALEINFF